MGDLLEDSLLSRWTDDGQCEEVTPVARERNPREMISLSWKRPHGVGAGLWNLGNTCYVNATLQCLTYTPPLANYMLSREHKPTCPSLTGCMLCALQRHVTHALRHPGRVIQPLHTLIAAFHRQKQEDAHEFLMFIVDAMQQAELHSEDRELMHHIFGGYWRSQIKCLHCGSTSDTFDPYLDITLDIKAAQSVKQALTRSIAPEELSGDNAYHCSVCLQKMPATKTMSLHTSSEVLILVLKRFSDFTGEKFAKHVQYSECLDMQPYMSEQNRGPLLYTLYAVLIHAGSTCHSGHYFSYVKAGDGRWYQMNDNKVTACDTRCVLAQDAYVLFYVRKTNLPKDSGAPPAGTEAKPLGSEAEHRRASPRELSTEACREHSKLGVQREETQMEQSTFEEWESLREQNRTKTALNLRQVESNLPADAVVIHRSKYTVELRATHPEQENCFPPNSARVLTAQEATNAEQAPFLGGSARDSKRKKKKKNKQGKRTVLVL
ncbi:Ubiquitin carboxyl-terminal hydrolase 17 [Heterocephalus glaber]|uniref:Ubiquitin carboxyl-terminal hydrolase n=1 Tax=Heterocephalus glaber TaxID=10181 RepID=G5B7F3_HETGA|nr:Ubiquitin carboxyl-terminal hydrolase 17 [Heterocephalus glaber]